MLSAAKRSRSISTAAVILFPERGRSTRRARCFCYAQHDVLFTLTTINNYQSTTINQQPSINNHQSTTTNQQPPINNHQSTANTYSRTRRTWAW
jgi:hypothetical protein